MRLPGDGSGLVLGLVHAPAAGWVGVRVRSSLRSRGGSVHLCDDALG